MCVKIIHKLMPHYPITKTIIKNYDLIFFQIVKTIISHYDIKFKVKISSDYSFNNLKKI